MKKLDVPQSGSQADTVASRNRFGQYNRTRATPIQPRTERQLLVRGRLTDASQGWRVLTDAARAAWNAYAAVTPKVDSLGQTIFLTGHQWFVALWGLYDNAGLATPPEVPSVAPEAPPGLDTIVLDDTPTMNFSPLNPASATNILVVEASPQLSAGVSFNRDLRFIQSFNAAPGVDGYSLLAAYVAKFGALILGRRVFFRARLITVDGGAGAPTEFSAVVVAAV